MNWVDASGREPKRDLTRCVTKITALRVAPTQDGVTPQVTLPFFHLTLRWSTTYLCWQLDRTNETSFYFSRVVTLFQ